MFTPIHVVSNYLIKQTILFHFHSKSSVTGVSQTVSDDGLHISFSCSVFSDTS